MLARLVIGLLLFAVPACSSGGSRPVEGPARAMQRLSDPVRAAASGYVDALHGVTNALAKVTDTASARGAMPILESELANLQQHQRYLAGLDSRTQADVRYAFYRNLDSADRRFDAQVARVKGTPGVGTVLSPLLDKIPRWR